MSKSKSKPHIAAEAKRNQEACLKRGAENPVPQKSVKREKPIDTQKELAKLAGVSTIEALAQAVGVATRTLQGWIARGCPRTDAEAVKAWRAANMQPRYRLGIDAWREERAARIAKLTADADGIELENAARNKELYVASEVKANVAELLGIVRTRLANLPNELATLFPADWQAIGRQRVGDKIDLVLRQLEQWRPEYETPEVETDDEATDDGRSGADSPHSPADSTD